MSKTARYARRVMLSVAAVALLSLPLLSGCSKPATDTSGQSSGTSTQAVVVTKADADKTVAVSPGQTLEVTLDANPSTGYTWTVVSAPEFLKSEGEAEFSSDAASGVVGAGGQQTLKFSATAAGKGPLNLAYVRPWEKDTPPAETFMVEVESK
jgi:inhibitor of cysteine peptidase